MKVLVARTAGFCWGVKRAMDAVLEASARSNGNPVSTLGPLIHNPQALALLARRGVGVTEKSPDFSSGTLVVRAHGIPIEELRSLKKRQEQGEIRLVNATCPEVAKVHAKIRKWSSQGYFTVILGSHGHAESLAHRSFAEHGSVIVANLAEAEALTDAQLEKVMVVAQTTFSTLEFDKIITYLKSRAKTLVEEKTICKDTTTRQLEARQIAEKVQAIIIVGGKNSSNTRHLAELAEQYGKPCQFVETAAELETSSLRGLESVGVLAGASTPTWLVEEVVFTLHQLGRRSAFTRRNLWAAFLRPLYMGVGVALTTFGIHRWMGTPRTWQYPLITGAYLLAMYLLTPFLDPNGLVGKGPARERLLGSHRWLMLSVGVVSLLLSVGIALIQGVGSGILLCLAALFGLIYKRSIVINGRVWSLTAIPGSKDILIALTLGVVAVALPLWHHGWRWHSLTWAGLLQVAALAFAHSTIHNIQGMQSDQILGRETLPILIGRQAAKHALVLILLFAWLFSTVSGFTAPTHCPWLAMCIFAVATAYPLLHLWLFHERFRAGRPQVQLPLEMGFFVLGILGLL